MAKSRYYVEGVDTQYRTFSAAQKRAQSIANRDDNRVYLGRITPGGWKTDQRYVDPKGKRNMAKKRKPKFGSPAWRKLYAAKAAAARRKNAAKKKPKKKRSSSHSRGTANKKKRMKEMIRQNPPRNWTKVKAVRVVRRAGRDVLEIRK